MNIIRSAVTFIIAAILTAGISPLIFLTSPLLLTALYISVGFQLVKLEWLRENVRAVENPLRSGWKEVTYTGDTTLVGRIMGVFFSFGFTEFFSDRSGVFRMEVVDGNGRFLGSDVSEAIEKKLEEGRKCLEKNDAEEAHECFTEVLINCPEDRKLSLQKTVFEIYKEFS